MNRKQKKEQKRLLSTRQLMGIDQFTDNGLKAGRSELVYFLIQPDNLSVLSAEGIRGKVMALTNLLRGVESMRLLAVYYQQDVTTEIFDMTDGERWAKEDA